jgi:hypothetical protein
MTRRSPVETNDDKRAAEWAADVVRPLRARTPYSVDEIERRAREFIRHAMHRARQSERRRNRRTRAR